MRAWERVQRRIINKTKFHRRPRAGRLPRRLPRRHPLAQHCRGHGRQLAGILRPILDPGSGSMAANAARPLCRRQVALTVRDGVIGASPNAEGCGGCPTFFPLFSFFSGGDLARLKPRAGARTRGGGCPDAAGPGNPQQSSSLLFFVVWMFDSLGVLFESGTPFRHAKLCIKSRVHSSIFPSIQEQGGSI